MSHFVLKSKRAVTIAAVAAVIAMSTFILAGHVSLARTVQPTNALHQVPTVTGIDSSAPLLW